MYRKDFSNLQDAKVKATEVALLWPHFSINQPFISLDYELFDSHYMSGGYTIDYNVRCLFDNSVTDVEGDRLREMCQPAICPHNSQPAIAEKELFPMINSLDQSNSNGQFRDRQSSTKVIDGAPDSPNLETNSPNYYKTSPNQDPDSASNDWHDKKTANSRARTSNLEKPVPFNGGRSSSPIPNTSSNELQSQLNETARQLGEVTKAFQWGQVELQQAKVQLAKLQGDSKENRETIEALQRQFYQTEQQRQRDRTDDSKRQQARELQTEERLKNHFYAAVRPAVEEIIPQRDRSCIPEPARQPMNPPMPSQRKPGRVEAIAGGVPRLVMYGLIAIFSCLSAVFLFNPDVFYNLLVPTKTTLSILLSTIIVSGGVILLANSWE